MSEIKRGSRVRFTTLRPTKRWPAWCYGLEWEPWDEVGTVLRIERTRVLVVWDGNADDADDCERDGMPCVIAWLLPVWSLVEVTDG